MGRKPLITLILATGGALLASSALADTRAGVDAWSRGDHARAIREWQASAAKGDADALFNLGQAHKLGKGYPRDLAKAEDLFARAAAQGHLQAGDNLGLLLFQRGEKARAMPYLRAAADRGDSRAQYLVGLALFNGDTVAKDWPRAYALVSLARQQGLTQAGSALQQMDQYIPLDQRQRGAALATELQVHADATRARQMAAVDLGADVAVRKPAPEGPASAGADYARPLPARPALTPLPAARPTQPDAKTGGAWRIQLGAFARQANADALWSRIKSRPELAGHQRLDIRAGAVTRLLVGGYPSRAAAQAACGQLRAAGFACMALAG